MKKIKKAVSFLMNASPLTNRDVAIVAVLVRIAQIATANRLLVKSPHMVVSGDHTTPANLYAQTFYRSGGGKDMAVNNLKNATSFFESDFEQRAHVANQKLIESIVKKAEKDGIKEREIKKILEETNIRELAPVIRAGTAEGFAEDRRAYAEAEFGGVFVSMSEWADYITNDSPQRLAFLTVLNETFDFGNLEAVSIKSDNKKIKTEKIPTSVYVYSSTKRLLSGIGNEKLKTYLGRGFARRCITCFPDLIQTPIEDEEVFYQENKRKKEKAKRIEPDVVQDFRSFYEWTKMSTVFLLDTECERQIDRYYAQCINAGLELDEDISAEVSGRPWKAYKLAGLIAAFEHPEKNIITTDDLDYAIRIVEYFGVHFQRFYVAREDSEIQQLTNFFINSDWVSLGDIREQNFTNKDRFALWFEEVFPDVIGRLFERGYVVEEKRFGKSNKKFKAVKQETVANEATFNISVAPTNSEKETKFVKKEILFEEIKTILKTDKAWSPALFKNNYRKNSNVILSFRLFSYDIDEGMSIKEAEELLKMQNIRAVIATTRNHQKEKNGKTTDRFRVVIPLLYEWTPEDTAQYRRGVRFMADKIGLPVDAAATDAARFFYGNPDAQIIEIQGQAVDMSVYQEKPETKKTFTQEMTERTTPQSDEGIKEWFVENISRYGGRNATLFQVAVFYMGDKGMTREEAHQKVLEVNEMFQDPLPIPEIEKTIFKTPSLDTVEKFTF